MNKNKLISAFFVFVFFLFFVIVGSSIYIYDIIESPYNVQNDVKEEFVIKQGEGVNQIATDLEKRGFIAGKDFFKIYVWQKKIASKLQAGKYKLSPSMTIKQIANIFVNGKIINNEVSIKFVEGISNNGIDIELAKNGFIKKGKFINFDKNIKQTFLNKYKFLKDKPRDVGLQGYYFPDTYKYYSNSSVSEIAEKMLHNFDTKLTSNLREEIKKQNKTIFEVITLASIIEKEAGNKDDMKKISSVFQNRLKIGKALESDATLNYIINSNRSSLTSADLKIDSPYNTYMYKGLPPGPISNPGIEAIKAVIYPEKTDYLYFLTRKDNGRAVFSKTYQEHLNNKNKYLK